MFIERKHVSHLNLKPGDYCEVYHDEDGTVDFGIISEIAYPLIVFQDGRKYPWNSIFYRQLRQDEIKQKYFHEGEDVFTALHNQTNEVDCDSVCDYDNSWLLSCDNIYELGAQCRQLQFTIQSWCAESTIYFWINFEKNIIICFTDQDGNKFWTTCPKDKYTQICGQVV